MFDKSDHDLEDACVDYDADHVDKAFVTAINKAKPNNTPLTLDVLERAMDAMEKAQGRSEAGDGLVPYATVRQTLALVEMAGGHPESTRRELHSHWHKRRTERGFPFLRLYQQAPDPSNNDPAVAFRPRDKDNLAGAGRRMNTYDNFRRAVILRDELKTLINVMDRIVDRETQKAQLLGLRLLQQRVALTSAGGPRIESVNRAMFSGEQEPVVIYGPTQMQVLVPCRNLRLPPEIDVVLRRLGSTAAEKAAKKARRRAIPRTADKNRLGRDHNGQISNGNQKTGPGGTPAGVDTFGYDEMGNRFLKDMRFFAGGFMNYGVSPYDHRVFAAASERNTVRFNPREPRPVLFPGPQVRFGSLPDTDERQFSGKIGDKVISCDDIRADIFEGRKRRIGESFHPSTTSARKIRRAYYTRARVGRGGRVMLDRVVFQRERGVKAASYPASVEGGGVYTAGIPLDAASRTSRVVRRGGLGDIMTLGAGLDEEEDVSDADESESLALARKLIPSLKPIVRMNAGIGVQPDAVNYWPRRHRGKMRGGKTRGGKRRRGQTRQESESLGTSDDWEQHLKSLPAYAPRETPLVTQV
ncbi:unnamed protein product [Chondrus crispus]|uniref:Enhancer of polycomb-like protein n=1 Tax=Chondrus crispus TaxID=2769 RepID=S0F329_CHOCR|nr:unnamed protein product [Chondrus crispus]CDF77585.1 unnamed protein product [Chondrus crispus]|eukprot:XP_005718269.1 unnamed protein product [Chondrus crispus]